MINAVIFVRPENYGVTAARCLDYCAAKRYNVIGLIPGDWPAAMRMLNEGLAGVVVVASAEQLDPDREPRVEVVPRRLNSRRRPANARQYSTASAPALRKIR
ncbi:hypothetical protein HH310_20435 [Actinoplanes sp. TBRC 11911]|uniref:hypothetical protein n=1 Tax=Actinoplanes sp. TBRC 11911 TaxID=2729386 RepID=UPI00145E35A9|nr:hypothetical protein [Actinoplanes sp. TBRC 11911]NMO53541.1 hypothetical protein [Actinoplanes sp. TBRC 11911]